MGTRRGSRPWLGAAAAALLAVLSLALPATAAAAPSQAAAARQVLCYWTPERMREARPLEMSVGSGGAPRLTLGRPAPAVATASFLTVPTPDQPPYSVNGRIFLKQGPLEGFCSGTAINSPSRQLVLTAGHCVNSGAVGTRHATWSRYLEFVPAYTGGAAPFGAFVAERGSARAPSRWTKGGNPDYDLGAFLVHRNAAGENLADAVGGGDTVVLDLSRQQRFWTFGYPGGARRMQTCKSPYIGDDSLTYPLPGPPTLGIRCHWQPGASGGGWLIAEGTEINGVNSYQHVTDKSRTYGPYFTQETVGPLVRNR
ncbi:MAG TPA: hypothetical protein VFJ99_01345 [Solirubrobacterales bacterium]|nr:hypothetical protein [Solirubrobacterales bacterium]